MKKQPLFLKRIYLQNFRKFCETEYCFNPHLNVIFGENAQGKSTLLEAISLLSTGRSFRSQHLSELIQHGKEFFFIDAEVIKDDVSHSIQLSFDGKIKKLRLNGSQHATFFPLLGSFPSVFSLPSDRGLITDSPSVRRRFLNLHLAQSDPLYVHHLARFNRAMKQRNCLLKRKQIEGIDSWETEMAFSAEYISNSRGTFLQKLEEPLLSQGEALSRNREKVQVGLVSTHPGSVVLYQNLLQKMRNKEKEIGLTLQGPHRDDISFQINKQPAKNFASEGQKKSLITSLRLSQWKHLSKEIDDFPFFAIDDFEGMLDQERQKYLSETLQSMGQVFLTTPIDPEKLPIKKSSLTNYLRIY